jgi:hypothetical protein
MSAIQEAMYTRLKQAFPKAMRECELYEFALNAVPASQRDSKIGGTYMRNMVKWGCARKIATGYYIAIAPFKPLQGAVAMRDKLKLAA